MLLFTTKLIEENIQYDTTEILDVKWFSYDEIINMGDKLRGTYIKDAIEKHKNGLIAPIEIVEILK